MTPFGFPKRRWLCYFGKDIRTINEHITNIFDDEELEKESTIRKFRIVRQEGKRQVNREIEHYDLDMIISVGYRVKNLNKALVSAVGQLHV